MKTLHFLLSKAIRAFLVLGISILMAFHSLVFSQDIKTVFTTDSNTEFNWGVDLKTSSIQKELGTQYGMYAGTLFNHSVFVGATGALNVSHSEVNYGYLGFLMQYAYRPFNMIHMTGQVMLGIGSTKDYQQDKSNTLDNFGNISGAGFYLMEPSLNMEINVGVKTRLVIGAGYRFVYGIDQESEHVILTHVSDRDLSGLTISVGVKFGSY